MAPSSLSRSARTLLILGLGLLARTAVANAATLSRGPYLQLLTDQSVTIVWNTDVAAACALAIHPVGGPTSTIPGGTGTVCSIPVGSLAPDASYAYTPLADGAAIDTESVFRTDDPTLPFTFLVVGDSGCNCPAQTAIRDRMLTVPADLVLHTGDMIYETGAAADFNPKFFAPYRDLLRELVFWPCLGNHDVAADAGASWRAAFSTPANNAAASENYYSFDFGNAHFVVLDSNASTAPGSAQHTFLDQDLAASTAEWKFVAFHHTIYSNSQHGSNLGIRANLVPLFDARAVDVVFMGHDHDYERTYALTNNQIVAPGTGTVYVTTGGGGRALYPAGHSATTAYAESAYHFTRVDVNGATLHLEMIRDDGAVRDTLDLPPPNPTATPAASATPTLPTPVCGAAPEGGCRTPFVPGKSLIVLKDRDPDDGNGLAWSWKRGAATSKADFGNPLVTDAYELCIYDGADALVSSATVPAGGTCGQAACWRENATGFKYRSRDRTPDGVQSLILHRGVSDGEAKITLKGKGTNLAMPALATLAQPLTVQIKRAGGLCWQAVYGAPASRQSPEQFRDTSD